MFRKILNVLKGGLMRLRLIKSLEKISDHPEIAQHDKMFNLIEKWMKLYEGYYGPFHKVEYKTIQGTKKRIMQTLNMPKIVASEMASLVYNEKCEINIDKDEVSEFINDVFKKNKFNKNFQDYLEYSFASGGMVIKPYLDRDKIALTFVTAESFIPISWKNGSIYEAVFPFEFVEKGKKYTHLEWHLWENGVYIVRNELYQSQHGEDLGVKVPLKTVNRFKDLKPEVKLDNIKRSLFTYFKPNSANNFDRKSPLGISIFANALDTLKAIDTAFDSFHREFRLGKKRILVPAKFVKTVIDPETGKPVRYFDDTDETYEAFAGEMDDSDIKDVSVELRVSEHIAGINALLNVLAMQTGFSTGSFSFDGQSMKTATEVVSEQSKTFKSKQSHETIIEAALQELVGSIIALAELYDLETFPDDYEVAVGFDDSIVEDRKADLEKAVIEKTNNLKPQYKIIAEYNKIPEEEARKWLLEIEEEERRTAPIQQELNAEGALFGSQE